MVYHAAHIYRIVCLRNDISPGEMLRILDSISEKGEIPEPFRGRNGFARALRVNGIIAPKPPRKRPYTWQPGATFSAFRSYVESIA
ncbi:MAG TPA: hypothetical protein PK659_10580 [Methanothrix sp.]|nr:hypothetical protein [Methanothrix sp.]HOL44688.1 hypothetical protein [Methanothrix sp.]